MKACIRALTALAAFWMASPIAAEETSKLINTPAEKFITAPGGVDMRTGRYAYSETDLSIGGESGGLALTRTLTSTVGGHGNPFANLSHNWDIMVTETYSQMPNEYGHHDLLANVHFGGRSQTYAAPYVTGSAAAQRSSGLAAPLTFEGDRAAGGIVYTYTASDGKVVVFRPLGQDCSSTWSCAYVSQITEADGTRFTFDYVTSEGAGGAVRLARVTSSRGYALLLEGSGNLVTRACMLNLAQAPAVLAGGACPAGVPTANYGYATTDATRLASVTGTDNGVSGFTYGAAANGGTTMGFVKPGESAPWLTNTIHLRPDELEVPQEIVYHQTFVDGQSYSYGFTSSPFVTYAASTLAGGFYTNALGEETHVNFDWPVAPGANHPGSYCQPPQCRLPNFEDVYTTYVYQQTPGPVTIVDPLQRTTTFDYCDPAAMAGLPATEENRCIVVAAARAVVGPDGSRTELKYDGNLNIIEAKRFPRPGALNPDGTVPAPIVTSAVYVTGLSKSANKPLSMTDARGQATSWTYAPEHGGVLTETAPAVYVGSEVVRPQKRYTYVQRTARIADGSPAGPPVWLLDRMSSCRTGNPAAGGGCALGAADEVVTAYDYGPSEGANNLLLRGQAVSADGQTLRTCFAYDGRGRKISETSPEANLQSCPGSPPTTAMAHTVSTRYDARDRVTGTISPDPDGNEALRFAAVRNTYDVAGRLIKVEQGQLTDWQPDTVAPANWPYFDVLKQVDTAYDALDRKVREAVSGDGVITNVTEYNYDLAGRVKCTAVRMNPDAWATPLADKCVPGPEHDVHRKDRITQNVYDAAGQLVQTRSGVGTNYIRADSFEHNLNGQRTALVDARGYRAEMTYDGHGRQARWIFPSKTGPGAANPADYEEYGYDPNGNRTRLRKRDGQELTYIYDALNRVEIKDVPGIAGDVRYTYDLRGLQTAAWFPATSQGISNTYDGFGRNVSTTSNMGGVSRTVAHQYDRGGGRTELTFPDGQKFRFERDGLGRMTQAHQGSLGSQPAALVKLAYNEMGLRSSLARKSAATSQYQDSTQFEYDRIGRLASIADQFVGSTGNVQWTFPGYNPAGQLAAETRNNDAYAWSGAVPINRTYAVNGLNQYTGTTSGGAPSATFGYDANGNLTSDGTRSYAYDVENRLVSATSGGTTVTLLYDPLGRLSATSKGPTSTITWFLYDGNELVAEYDYYGNLLRRYVHGDGEDDPLFWFEGAGLTQPRFPHADRQGSIVGIAGPDGKVQAINNYDEYGIPGAGNSGRFQYTGQAWIPELGMYYYKARIYSPTLGRFLQVDPIGYDGGVNLYAYVDNDPINRTDPTGLCDETRSRICAANARQIKAAREEGVRKAWAAERKLVARGEAGTRSWSRTERAELLKTGKVSGYQGHHINTVTGNPLEFARNPNNVEFRTPGEHAQVHRENGGTRKPITGKPLIVRGLGVLEGLSMFTGILSGRIRTDNFENLMSDMLGYESWDDTIKRERAECASQGREYKGHPCVII